MFLFCHFPCALSTTVLYLSALLLFVMALCHDSFIMFQKSSAVAKAHWKAVKDSFHALVLYCESPKCVVVGLFACYLSRLCELL